MSTRPCPICQEEIGANLGTCPVCGNDLNDLTIIDESAVTGERISDQDKTGKELARALEPRIEVVRRLGAGGMSTVYLGRDPALRRFVAIKVLSDDLADDPLARARFTREAEASAAISDPHVIEIFQVDTLPRTKKPYIMMQFVDGPTLQQELLMGAPLPEATAKAIIGEVAQALAAAHSRGVVHRDIKPSNVVLDRESGHAVVLDFGISAALQPGALGGPEKLTMTGLALGTPAYMSPEQAAAKEVSDRSDVYSLGVVAYELVTGNPPFTAEAPEGYLAAHLQDSPPHVGALRPELDGMFADLIMRSLSKNKDERPSADAIARALLRRTRLPIDWPPPGLASLRGVGWRALNLAAGAGGAALALMLGLALPNAATISVAGSMTLLGFLLGALGVFTGLTAVMIARLVNRWIWARKVGYPINAIVDVAIDHQIDTRALLNGSGPYALLEPKGRKIFMRLRRIRAVLTAFAAVFAWLGPVAWVVGMVGSQGKTEGALVSSGDVQSLVLLPSIALLLVLLLGIPETRMRKGARFLRIFRQLIWKPREIQRESINRWLSAAGHATIPPTDKKDSKKKPRQVFGLVAGGLGLLFGAGVFTALTAAFSASQTAHRWRATYSGAIAPVEWSWEDFDRSISSARRLLDNRTALDSATAETLVRLIHESPDGSSGAEQLGSPSPWWGALTTGLSARAERELGESLDFPGVEAWRSVAHAPSIPPLWQTTESEWFETVDHSDGIEQQLSAFARANDAAAVRSMALGAVDTAVVRAREILSVGLHLLHDPRYGTAAPGLIDFGAAVLEQIGLYSDDRDLFLSAQRIRSGVPSLTLVLAAARPAAMLRFTTVVESDSSQPLLALSAPPYARLWQAAGVALGFCGNAGEVMFGFDPSRASLFEDIRTELENLPNHEAWTEAISVWLTAFVDDPKHGPLPPNAKPLLRFSFVGLGAAARRIAFCDALSGSGG